jgi:hypothetical protein
MNEGAMRRVTDMAEVRYLVIKRNGEWKVTLGRAKMGLYPDRLHAIDAAIDMADRDGRDGRDSQVLVRGEGRQLLIEWTYGRDPYPDYPELPALPREPRPSEGPSTALRGNEPA